MFPLTSSKYIIFESVFCASRMCWKPCEQDTTFSIGVYIMNSPILPSRGLCQAFCDCMVDFSQKGKKFSNYYK